MLFCMSCDGNGGGGGRYCCVPQCRDVMRQSLGLGMLGTLCVGSLWRVMLWRWQRVSSSSSASATLISASSTATSAACVGVAAPMLGRDARRQAHNTSECRECVELDSLHFGSVGCVAAGRNVRCCGLLCCGRRPQGSGVCGFARMIRSCRTRVVVRRMMIALSSSGLDQKPMRCRSWTLANSSAYL
ncbi:hypothetical protein RI054_09g49130 [Pseudoscourfieldia marina]